MVKTKLLNKTNFKKTFFKCFNTCFRAPDTRMKSTCFTYMTLQKRELDLTKTGCSCDKNGM